MDYRHQTVWITGASSGIGRALAHALASAGARLVLSARREVELNRVKEECGSERDILVLPFDLCNSDDLTVQAQAAFARFGKVDIVIYSAGVTQRSLAIDTDMAVARRFMDVNYFGAVALTKAVLPSMVARKSGHLVVLSSLAGKFGTPLRSSYAAAKHALHGYFDSLRAEVADAGIAVTIVCPGYIATDISLHSLVGDGSAYAKMDESVARGLSVDVCAQRILNAIRRRQEEVLIGGRETYAVYLKRFFPRLFSKIIRKAKVT
jgi:dehydrogenase/reductase SDR family member 7B